MPTHLTRHVFRALLANEPIIHRGCLRRRTLSTFRRKPRSLTAFNLHDVRHDVPIQQRRTFFNFDVFSRRKRDLKEAELDPGIDKMMELAKRQRMSARLPSKEEVAEAFTAFVKSKDRSGQSIRDTQAALLLQSLKYCTDETDLEPGSDGQLVSSDTVHMAGHVLRQSAKGASQHHKDLAEALYRISMAYKTHQSNYFKRPFGKVRRSTLYTYTLYLTHNGQTSEARDLLATIGDMTPEKDDSLAETLPSQDVDIDEAEVGGASNQSSRNLQGWRQGFALRLWLELLKGFALEGNEKELLRTYDIVMRHTLSFSYKAEAAQHMLTFYLGNGNIEQIQSYFSQYWKWETSDGRPDESDEKCVHRVLQWCLDNGHLERGQKMVEQVLAKNPPKSAWDAIFVWAAGTGKGVDEIDRMIRVMEDSNAHLKEGSKPRFADITTVNALVEFAVSKNDPYMAERFIALGRAREIAPDARTYVLQMEYRLRVQDVDGALVAYKNLQASSVSSDEDIPTINRLIVALCKSKRHDFDTIMNVAADLSDRQARFDAATISTLSVLHLNRDEFDDVVDLLNTHAFQFSSAERGSIRDAILALCIDPKTPTSRSWDALTLIRKVFDETPREQRTEIMLNFLRRERSDMAIRVFTDMRTHSRADTIPTVDTYVAAFVAAAKLRDLDFLEIIHNQLKLDFNIDVNTYLNNALLLAYTACGKPRKALDFWDDIVASKEGPTYNSIHIALRACEKSAFGDLTAQEIWSKLKRKNVDLDQLLWASYVAALAGNGDNQLAFSTVEEAEKNNELEVDSFLVGSLFAGAAGQSKQKEIEEWAQARYPHVWEQLLGIGIDEDESNMRAFRIDRSLTP